MVKRLKWLLPMLCLMLSALLIPAAAENSAYSVSARCDVDNLGNCNVSLTVAIHMDLDDDTLSFPVPLNATNITMNGRSVNTAKSKSAIDVYLTSETLGLRGDYAMTINYTLPKIVTPNDKRQLVMNLPLLAGFSYPIEEYTFIITLPAVNTQRPDFYSTYRQSGIESVMEYTLSGNMITGAVKTALNDHEAISLSLAVPQEMFPGISTYQRTGNPEVVPLEALLGVALLYWLLFLRTWFPLADRDATTPPEGLTAGEIGCRLTLAGGDLTMMTLSWGCLGYVLFEIDNRGRIWLHKRMDMGNERSLFEVRVFNALFAKQDVLDATGVLYTKNSKKTFAMVPGEKSSFMSSSGNIKVFRFICCASHVFCGICMAMNLTSIGALQGILGVLLAALAAVSAWLIQDIAYRTHLRGKTRVYIGFIAVLLWLVIGFIAKAPLIALGSVSAQLIAGFLAAYGGRRSELNRLETARILGLRRYLRHISQEDLKRNLAHDPDYFFRMAPYALAMGIIKPFCAAFGERRFGPCPYIVMRTQDKRTAAEWGTLLSRMTDRMDARFRRQELEKWTFIRIR